jgi:hypothetical protein
MLLAADGMGDPGMQLLTSRPPGSWDAGFSHGGLQNKKPSPEFGARALTRSRGSTRSCPGKVTFPLFGPGHLVETCNGVNRFPYWLRHNAPASTFRFLLAGGFLRSLPEKALNHWPALPVGIPTAYSTRSSHLDIVGLLYAGLEACQARQIKNPEWKGASPSTPGCMNGC